MAAEAAYIWSFAIVRRGSNASLVPVLAGMVCDGLK